MSDVDIARVTDASSTTNSAEETKGTKRSVGPTDDVHSPFRPTEDASEADAGCKRVKTGDSPLSDNLLKRDVSEGGWVPCYDLAKEAYPKLAFYHSSFAKAEQHIREACDIVIKAFRGLADGGYEDNQLSNICGNFYLQSCRDPANVYPAIEPVAVLGPAGSGKSSASNSIMNSQKAAFEHDGDERGTFVVHEYRYQEPHQTSRYLVKVPYNSEEEISADVRKHQNSIMQHLFADEDDEAAADDEEESVPEQKYKTALDFFCDMLCGYEQFQTTEKVTKWFELHGDQEPTDVQRELVGFVSEFLDSRKGSGQSETFYPNSEDELGQICKQIARPSSSSSKRAKKPSPWGVIRKIAVHQNIPLLRHGLVLADTPGINDQNLTVVQNTRRYLKVAGTVLVFLSYRRIQQNSPLDQLLRECVSLGKMQNTILVVTMIDGMKLFTEEEKEDLEDNEKLLVVAAELTLKSVENEISKTEKAKKMARGHDNDRYAELDGELERLELRKKKADAALKQVTIKSRCARLEEKLKGKLKEIDGSRQAPLLPIMFVSNTEYQKHVSGYDSKHPPELDILATGIPLLRKHLLTIPANGKLQNLKGLVENRLPNILHAVNGILTKSPMERKNEVRQLITQSCRKYDRPVNQLTKDISRALDKHVLQLITKLEPNWKDQALVMINAWSTMSGATFKGVCQRQGEWADHKSQGNIHWNLDIQKIYSNQMINAFNKLDEKLAPIQRDFRYAVDELFDELQNAIQNEKHAQGQDLRPFFESLKLIRNDMDAQMGARFEGLKQDISLVRHAVTLHTAGSYTAEAMEKTYKECLSSTRWAILPSPDTSTPDSTLTRRKRRRKQPSITGGRFLTIKERLEGSISQPSLFQDISQRARSELNAHIHTRGNECNQIIKNGYQQILDDFDGRFHDTGVKQEEDNSEVVEKMQQAVHCATGVLEEAKRCLRECEAWENEKESA